MGMDLDRIPADDTQNTPATAAESATQRLQEQSQADRSKPESSNINSILGNVIIGESTSSGPTAAGDKPQQRRAVRDANVPRELAEMLQGIERIRPQLSRTEQFFANSLTNALRDNDPKAVMQVLGALSENPRSAQAVLGQIRQNFGGKNTHVNWEQGQTDSGEPFVRLRLSNHNTSVTIGSDGTLNATKKPKEGGPAESIDPAAGLRNVLPRAEKVPFDTIPLGLVPNPNWKEMKNGSGSSTPETSGSPAEVPTPVVPGAKPEDEQKEDEVSNTEKLQVKLAALAAAKAKLKAAAAGQ